MSFLFFITLCIVLSYIMIRSGSNKMVSYNSIPVHIRKTMQICILCTQTQDVVQRKALVHAGIARIETLIDIYGVDTINDRCGINLHDVLDTMYNYKTQLGD